MARTIYDAVQSLRTLPHCGRAGRIDNTRELVMARLPYLVVLPGLRRSRADSQPRARSAAMAVGTMDPAMGLSPVQGGGWMCGFQPTDPRHVRAGAR